MVFIHTFSVLSVMLFTLEKPAVSFLTLRMDTVSPTQYRTQICQLPFTHHPTRSPPKNAGLLVSYTNCKTLPLTTFATNLKQLILQSRHPQTQHPLTPPPHSTLASVALNNFLWVFSNLLLKKTTCWLKASPLFLNYQLSVGLTIQISCLGKCHSVSPIMFIKLNLHYLKNTFQNMKKHNVDTTFLYKLKLLDITNMMWTFWNSVTHHQL